LLQFLNDEFMIPKAVSIIVCFYNAEKRLPKTIEYLQNLKIDQLEDIEVLFVDNNSSDGSLQLIKEMFSSFDKFSYSLHSEPTPGVTNARRKGLSEAKHNIILFCDDDNWFYPDYVELGLDIMTKDPQIGILGGQGILKSDVEIPQWAQKNQAYFACGPQASKSGLVRGDRNVIYGAGMFMRKDIYFDLVSKGFYIRNLSRTGKKLTTGEDDELSFAFHIAGYKVWYDERMKFYHYAHPSRLTMDYHNRLKTSYFKSTYVIRFYRDYLSGYEPKVSKMFWLKELCYATAHALSSLIRKPKKMIIHRNFHFVKYLISQRSKYNDEVLSILNICHAIDPKYNVNSATKQ